MSLHPTVEVTTKYGTFQVAFTQLDHAHVGGNIILRNVEYHIGVHVYQWTDGKFHVGRELDSPYEKFQHTYVTRRNPYNAKVSDAARRDIQGIVETVVAEALAQDSNITKQAEAGQLERAYESARGDYNEAVDAMRAAKDKMSAAFWALEAFKASL